MLQAFCTDHGMRILNGWKEIGECLNLTSRTAQRWERLGLPVRRVSSSKRSPIVALSDEIETWVRERRLGHGRLQSLRNNCDAFQATQSKTRQLLDELKAARREHRRLVTTILDQIGSGRASSSQRPREFQEVNRQPTTSFSPSTRLRDHHRLD